jgi:hypothetical protein
MKYSGRGFALGAVGALAAIGGACCISYGSFVKTLTGEVAIIVWDKEKKVEHFIRQADFNGQAKDFGFILPVPSQPSEIAVIDEEAFGVLESHKPRPFSIGCSAGADAAATAKSAGSVEVLSDQQIGDYRATVLRATDGQAMAAWLQANGHNMRPSMPPWLDYYAKKSWDFVAFKYNGAGTVHSHAVRVSFSTDKPFYPYKMPTDTWEKDHHRILNLYVLSDQEAMGRYSNDQPWESHPEWTAHLDDYQTNRIAAMLANQEKQNATFTLPANLTITRFENVEEATNYDCDLTFEPAPSKTPIYGGVAAGVAVIILRRRARAKRLAA